MSTDSGSRAVAILESTYDAARMLAPDLPPVAFTIKASGRKRNSVTLGHFAPGRYKSDGSPLHEVCVTGDTIKRGAEALLTTVLHEAAHALAQERGIKDTSRQNRYHNQRFVALAEELTLTYDLPENCRLVPDKNTGEMELKLVPDVTIGFSNVGPTEATRIRFAGVLDVLRKDFPFDLGHGMRSATKTRRITHGYVVVLDRYTDEVQDLVQLAPSKYRALRKYLQNHTYVESTADEDLVLHVLEDHGITVPDKRASRDYRYELNDIETEHPELLTLGEDLR